jgi:nicotinamidase-related amidase
MTTFLKRNNREQPMAYIDVDYSDALLMVIDVQERLFPAMDDTSKKRIVDAITLMGELAETFSMPVLVTEQYPKGLGSTIEQVTSVLPKYDLLDKTTFDCMKNDAMKDYIAASGKKTILVTGMETHICVYQTVTSLVEEGYNVIPVTDGLSSRKDIHWQWALSSFEKMGALHMPAETLAFIMLGNSGTPEFKRVSNILKSQ